MKVAPENKDGQLDLEALKTMPKTVETEQSLRGFWARLKMVFGRNPEGDA